MFLQADLYDDFPGQPGIIVQLFRGSTRDSYTKLRLESFFCISYVMNTSANYNYMCHTVIL